MLQKKKKIQKSRAFTRSTCKKKQKSYAFCHLCTVSPCKNKVQKYTNKCITQPQHHVCVLGQATGLHPHHRPHFVWPGNGGKKPWHAVSRLGMPPHLCHHRQVPWLAGDLPWCKVGVHIPSTAMRRRIPQWGLGKGSTVESKD